MKALLREPVTRAGILCILGFFIFWAYAAVSTGGSFFTFLLANTISILVIIPLIFWGRWLTRYIETQNRKAPTDIEDPVRGHDEGSLQ
jgi:hypothetical protein